jgi:hypothetical protein
MGLGGEAGPLERRFQSVVHWNCSCSAAIFSRRLKQAFYAARRHLPPDPMKILLFIIPFVLSGCGADGSSNQDDPVYARYACDQLALKNLKTLGSAKADPKDAVPAVLSSQPKWAGRTDVWDASGRLESQSTFGGALIRTDYRCTVQKMPDGSWKMLDFSSTQNQP